MSSPGSQLVHYCCHELTRTDLWEYHVQTKAVHASGRNKYLPSSIKQPILDEIGAVTCAQGPKQHLMWNWLSLHSAPP